MINISLIGNPNVGKSSLFNYLTKSHVHTGNWTGKTVFSNSCNFSYKDKVYKIHDLPGTYSLITHSYEEEITRNFIYNNIDNINIVVCDMTLLEKSLNLVLQVMEVSNKVILCLNMLDEARSKNIDVDINRLSQILKIPVVAISTRTKEGIDELKEVIYNYKVSSKFSIKYDSKVEEEINNIMINNKVNRTLAIKILNLNNNIELEDLITNKIINIAYDINKAVVTSNCKNRYKLDKILTNKITGIPIMLIMLFVIFWLTIIGSNYPSDLLNKFLFSLELPLYNLLSFLPDFITNLLIFGIYRTLAWIVSVMLIPMAIFFFLFSLLEDYGILPRIAFNLDDLFSKCNSCGKQALTMCMGFGCNAVGVTNARIIGSYKERLLAIITNVFVPCNGRFPMIIAIISMFFVISDSFLSSLYSALILLIIIIIGIVVTFIVTKILSLTILKGSSGSFILELPPYKKVNIIKVFFDTLVNKTLHILSRAVMVAIPFGVLIYFLSNYNILTLIADILNPIAYFIGLDGTILLAFFLGFPANEIVIPLMIMIYNNSNILSSYESLDTLRTLFINNGWNNLTAICVILFSLLHFPCATTCLSIKKETNSYKWMILSFVIPLFVASFVCFIISFVYRLLC